MNQEKMAYCQKLIGKSMFVISRNAVGIVRKVIDDETVLIEIGLESSEVSVFDIRSL